tara:strand:+ start:1229 stop:1375 length:147 start_codon:yes stop_codon:yes gene_type:complete
MTQKEADEFGKACEKFAKEATTSKRKARATLIKLGIYQKDGKLSPNYR